MESLLWIHGDAISVSFAPWHFFDVSLASHFGGRFVGLTIFERHKIQCNNSQIYRAMLGSTL